MSANAVLLAWLAVAAALYLVVLPYDLYRYSVCPRCEDNLSSKRRLFGSFAWCGVHGPFRPSAPPRTSRAGEDLMQ